MYTFEDSANKQHDRDVDVSRRGDAANKNDAQYIIQPFYNRPKVAKRRARRVFVLVSLLLVAPLTSDRDGDR
jgi:hypothetical protein